MFLDGEVKIKLRTVDILKKMNSTYPTTSSDSDYYFLSRLLKQVFKTNELKESGQLSMIRNLKRNKLGLVKGDIRYWLDLIHLQLTNSYLIIFIADIFAVRAGDDEAGLKRQKKFREIAIKIGQSL